MCRWFCLWSRQITISQSISHTNQQIIIDRSCVSHEKASKSVAPARRQSSVIWMNLYASHLTTSHKTIEEATQLFHWASILVHQSSGFDWAVTCVERMKLNLILLSLAVTRGSGQDTSGKSDWRWTSFLLRHFSYGLEWRLHGWCEPRLV